MAKKGISSGITLVGAYFEAATTVREATAMWSSRTPFFNSRNSVPLLGEVADSLHFLAARAAISASLTLSATRSFFGAISAKTIKGGWLVKYEEINKDHSEKR